MRLLIILVATVATAAPATSAGPAPAESNGIFQAAPITDEARAEALKRAEARLKACRRPTHYRAGNGAEWRGDGVRPKKLTELPPATAYMAVYRTINGCEVPMTVVEYRTGTGR